MQKEIYKAIVLLSGGQDSTTCLYWAKKTFKEVLCVGFDYGQKHSIELESAKKIAHDANVPYKIFNVKNLLASSSLTSNLDHNKQSQINDELPASFTSGRNILFLSIVGSYAASLGINDIVTGVCQTDFSGYPDCRRTSIDAMQNVLSLAYGAGDFRIHTPLMYLDKAETWKLAKQLGILDIIINDTITDYNGNKVFNEWGYGVEDNPATILRANGYRKAKKRGWI